MADNQIINFNSQDVADMYRRNQYARMLQEQAAAPIERSSYKGIEAPIHPTQVAAKVAAVALAQYQQYLMDKSYSTEKSTAEQKLVAERERSQNEFKEYGEQYNDKVSQGYSPDYVNSPSNYGTPQTFSTPLSPQQRLAVALKNRTHPNERIASDARAEIEQGNTMAQNDARTAERLATEETRQRERKEDIKIRAGEFKSLRDESAAQRNKQPTAPAGYRFTPSGDLQSIKGGPADVKQSAEFLKKKMDANDVLSILNDVDTLLPTSTGSVTGSIADAIAGSVGNTTKGAESAQQLRMLQGALVSKMPKMSGPQSDKDVQLYREMAGEVGDSTIPVKRRQAAAAMLRKLNEKYADAPDNTDAKLKSIMDMYAPPKVK